MFYNFARVVLRIVLFFAFRIEIAGLENMPREGGVIVALNHRSYWDPVMAGFTCPRQIRFMAKEELFKNPLFGALIRSLGAFPVSRGRGDIGAMKAALKILADGDVMLIFPEGKRVTDGSLVKAKPGVAAIANRAGVSVVPVSIKGEYKWLGRITVTYGEPLMIGEGQKLASGELQAAADTVMEKIRERA